MKRTLSILISAVLLLSVSLTAFADGETVITTVVPPPEYVLTIPASLGIEYRCTEFTLGNVTAAAVNYIKPGDCLNVSVTWSDFISTDAATTIPLSLFASDGTSSPAAIANGAVLTLTADETGAFTGGYTVSAAISADAWNAADPGSYAATVVFTSGIA